MDLEVIIEEEPFSQELMTEILPLAQKCWDEATEAKGENCAYHGKRGVQIEPDVDLYQSISDMGRLVIYTMRDEGKLVGYAVALIYPSPHHRKLLTANGDSIYVEEPYRTHSPVLIGKIIKAVEKSGAVTVNWGVTLGSPMYEVLKKFGFVADEVIMEKLLCAS